MRSIEFSGPAFVEFIEWLATDRKLAQRIAKLLVETSRTPFDGTGKPEALKNRLQGAWSRRIDQEHRLTYRVDDLRITVLSCRGHYD